MEPSNITPKDKFTVTSIIQIQTLGLDNDLPSARVELALSSPNPTGSLKLITIDTEDPETFALGKEFQIDITSVD